jgi:hypothetical protein
MSSQMPRKTTPSADSETPPSAAFRRFLTRGEAATLVGMLLVVFSIYLVWERYAMPANVMPLAGSMYMSPQGITRTGQALPPLTRWMLVGCAVACGALLLSTPTARTRLPLAVVQGACALTCVIVPLAWLARFALQSGILVALIGGLLLTFGALDRLSALKPNEPESH